MDRAEQYSRLMINQLVKYFGREIEKVQNNVICVQDEQVISQLLDEADEADVRYSYLFRLLEDECSIIALHLCVAQYIFPEFYSALKTLTGQGVTFKLACEICQKAGGTAVSPDRQYEAFERLTHIVKIDSEKTNYMYSELYCDSRLAEYLRGSDRMSKTLLKAAYRSFGGRRLYGVEGEIDRISALIEKLLDRSGGLRFIQVAGEEGSGRRSIVSEAAKRLEVTVIYVDYGMCLKMDTEKLLLEAAREALLYDGVLCLYNIEHEDMKREELRELFGTLHRVTDTFSIPVIICTLPQVQLQTAVDDIVLKCQLDMRSFDKREAVWRGLAAEQGVELDAEEYASKYSLLPGQLVKLWGTAQYSLTADIGSDELKNVIGAAAAQVIDFPEKGTIALHRTEQSLEDLVLPEAAMKSLRIICAYSKERAKVFGKWKLERKYPYGRGMAALFVGGPGTGKTMAAGCIANELGIPLYKVDLSQIVDKYIGETEKRLEQVFSYAQKSNVILFFDEADALFGKRSEVKDSKDKYANTEVSYILQRIEQYDGMVILATNLVKNMDEAFLRRMKYMVEFPMPDEDIRLKIWKGSFSDAAPVTGLDYEFLARKIELAGGHIKNIVLNAAFIAAERGESIGMGAVLYASANEYYKLGRTVGRDFFEKYYEAVKAIMEI